MRIKALKAFLVLAENNCNFAVHKLMGIPRSNLWFYVDEIEEELGIKLIDRRKKQSTFTPEGLTFVPYAEKIIRTFEEAKSKATHDDAISVEGTIVISTTVAVATGWLMPSIKNFHLQFPNLRVNIIAEDSLSKEIENSADILLRPLGDENHNISKKWHITYNHALFASKDYLKRMGTPKIPEDLIGHSILSYGEHEFSYFEDVNWHTKGKFGLPRLTPTLTINSTHALFSAATQGIGICSSPIESNMIYGGNLIRVLPQIDGPVVRTSFAMKKNDSPLAQRNMEVFRSFFENYLLSLGVKIYYEKNEKPKK